MLTRIGDEFFNTDDIFHVGLSDDEDNLSANVSLLKAGMIKTLKFSGESARYLRAVLDAYHILGIKQLQENTGENT